MADRALGNPLGNPLALPRNAVASGSGTYPSGSILATPEAPSKGTWLALDGTEWDERIFKLGGIGAGIKAPTKLADPAQLPAGVGRGCSFSPDGAYLAVSHGTSPYITIYRRDGDTFTKLADPAQLPSNAGFSCAFSPDGIYLAVAHNTSPFVTIYRRDGDTFTKLADPAQLPAGVGRGCAFSPDGAYLEV